MNDHDHDGTLEEDHVLPARTVIPPGPYVAVRHRAAGSPSVYFGPFDTWDELTAWADQTGFPVQVINLVDPESSRDGWWD